MRRLVVQRDDPPDPPDPFKPDVKPRGPSDPGGPLDTNDQGFTCGIENGKFTCHVDPGKGDPLNLPGTLPPSGPSNQPDIGTQGACPPKRWNPPGAWNMFNGRCCNVDQVYDGSAHKCVAAPAPAADTGVSPAAPAPAPEPFVLPPAPPEEKGDFPTSTEDPDTQVA